MSRPPACLLGAGVHPDDGPEAVGRILEAVLVVEQVPGFVDHTLGIFVVRVQRGELVECGEPLGFPLGQGQLLVFVLLVPGDNLACGLFTLDHLGGCVDCGAGAEHRLLALCVDLDDGHVLLVGLVVALELVQELAVLVAHLVGVLSVGELVEVDVVGATGELVGFDGPRTRAQLPRFFVVVDGHRPEVLFEEAAGVLDGVLVCGVCLRPGAGLAVVPPKLLDFLFGLTLQTHLLEGLDDFVLVLRRIRRLGVLTDEATVGPNRLFELALLEVHASEALHHLLDELFATELGEVGLGFIHGAGVCEEADEVLECFFLEHDALLFAFLRYRSWKLDDTFMVWMASPIWPTL